MARHHECVTVIQGGGCCVCCSKCWKYPASYLASRYQAQSFIGGKTNKMSAEEVLVEDRRVHSSWERRLGSKWLSDWNAPCDKPLCLSQISVVARETRRASPLSLLCCPSRHRRQSHALLHCTPFPPKHLQRWRITTSSEMKSFVIASRRWKSFSIQVRRVSTGP